MTRKELIDEAATQIANERKKQFPTLNPAAFDNEKIYFIQGAQWADANPTYQSNFIKKIQTQLNIAIESLNKLSGQFNKGSYVEDLVSDALLKIEALKK